MSRYAGQAGSSLHLVAPQPLLVEIIRITGLDGKLGRCIAETGPGKQR